MPVYWGVRWDLNPHLTEPQSVALPIKLLTQSFITPLYQELSLLMQEISSLFNFPLILYSYFLIIVGMIGLEPMTSTLSEWCSNHLNYIPIS